MAEPHQRVQSGKLRAVSKRSNSESAIITSRQQNEEYVGVQSAIPLEPTNYEYSWDCFQQTPSRLSAFHINLLQKMAEGYGIPIKDAIDPEWRRTWNIGTWCIGNDVSVSINIMQPNISSGMASIHCQVNEQTESIIKQFETETLAKSTALAKKISKGYQLMGRWTLHIAQKFIDLDVVSAENVIINGANIGQSRIFCWVLVGKQSRYLATLTRQSCEELMRFLPDWCNDIRETSSAGDITLRIRNPETVNDFTILSISTDGKIRYQGSLYHISKLPEALSTAIKSIMKSKRILTFLDSLEYREMPANF